MQSIPFSLNTFIQLHLSLHLFQGASWTINTIIGSCTIWFILHHFFRKRKCLTYFLRCTGDGTEDVGHSAWHWHSAAAYWYLPPTHPPSWPRWPCSWFWLSLRCLPYLRNLRLSRRYFQKSLYSFCFCLSYNPKSHINLSVLHDGNMVARLVRYIQTCHSYKSFDLMSYRPFISCTAGSVPLWICARIVRELIPVAAAASLTVTFSPLSCKIPASPRPPWGVGV